MTQIYPSDSSSSPRSRSRRAPAAPCAQTRAAELIDRSTRPDSDVINRQIEDLQAELTVLASRCSIGLAGNTGDVTAELSRRVVDLAKRVGESAGGLRAAPVPPGGVITDLNRLVADLSTTHVAVTVTHSRVPDSVAPEVTACLMAVAQEALRNAVKHSQTDRVIVHLHGIDDRQVEMTVTDYGVGLHVPTAMTGRGLSRMRNAIERLGGSLTVRSQFRRGTRVEVCVPCVPVARPRSAE